MPIAYMDMNLHLCSCKILYVDVEADERESETKQSHFEFPANLQTQFP
jgi:hypothetical protein